MLHEVSIPSPGESVSEVSISAWLKKDGDIVKKNQELFEIESDKATLSVSAEVEGQLKILIPQGETIRVGAVACTIDTAITAGAAPAAANGAPAEKKVEAPKAQAPAQSSGYAQGVPSPSAQKMMAEQNIKPEEVQASGRGGRITKSDVLEYGKSSPAPQVSTPAPATKPAPMIAGSRTERREKMSNLRQKISERLVYAKNQTAMLTTFNEIDMSNAMAIRAKYKDKFKEAHQVGLGFMSFFSRAAVEALKQFPAVNAYIDGTDIIYHDFVDLGIAVQAPKGLVVPVVRNAESMTMDQFEAEIERLALRARNNQLTIDEMTGGTFTISNGGVFGNLMSTPILNPPQSAILGMHNIVKRPIAIDDQVVIRPMMYVAVSYDHRIIDGRESVGFLKRIKELVEDPIRLLLNV